MKAIRALSGPETLLAVLGILAATVFLYSVNRASATERRVDGWKEGIESLEWRLSQAQLWPEESVANGQAATLVRRVQRNVATALDECRALRDGGSAYFGYVERIRDPRLHPAIVDLCARLRRLRELTVQRGGRSTTERVGARQEQAYDRFVAGSLDASGDVELGIRAAVAQERRNLGRLNASSVFVLLGGFVWMVVLVRRHRAEIEAKNFELTEAAELERMTSERERRVADELRAADEMKNTFLQAVSHELRTPLTAVIGTALLLKTKGASISPAVRQEMVVLLADNAAKLERLLTDLLDVDRLSRGILVPRLSSADVADVVRRVVAETPLEGHPVHSDIHSVIAEVDVAKVERIVENLLVNAVRHTAPGTPVWVSVKSIDEGVLIAVEDGGPGVPDDLKEAIFEPFRQGAHNSPHSPGTGIGLSLVARLAELHGGRAWVEDRIGGGASFRVVLPRTPRPVQAASSIMGDRAEPQG